MAITDKILVPVSVKTSKCDIIIGSDHAGFSLKEALKSFIAGAFPLMIVHDVGTNSEIPVDYPDFGAQVAAAISRGEAPWGILICGSGIGMSIVANRYPLVRAALCLDKESAILSRKHNNANILVLAGRKITASQAEAILKSWLETAFEGGRHQTRIAKIDKI